jgi:hypothetical protein
METVFCIIIGITFIYALYNFHYYMKSVSVIKSDERTKKTYKKRLTIAVLIYLLEVLLFHLLL